MNQYPLEGVWLRPKPKEIKYTIKEENALWRILNPNKAEVGWATIVKQSALVVNAKLDADPKPMTGILIRQETKTCIQWSNNTQWVKEEPIVEELEEKKKTCFIFRLFQRMNRR